MLGKAKLYSSLAHQRVNHRYNDHPYPYHLQMVFDYGKKYEHLLSEEYRSFAFTSCWTHDLIEDCRLTYNDVKQACGEMVAEITFALTNEKGRNRADRANEKYYEGIRNTPTASFVKLCDRLANVKFSKENNSSMLTAYKKENENFKRELYTSKYAEMFAELDELLS